MRNFLLIIITSVSTFSQNEKVKVTGDYTYAYGDSETLLEAKNICYSMAVR